MLALLQLRPESDLFQSCKPTLEFSNLLLYKGRTAAVSCERRERVPVPMKAEVRPVGVAESQGEH